MIFYNMGTPPPPPPSGISRVWRVDFLTKFRHTTAHISTEIPTPRGNFIAEIPTSREIKAILFLFLSSPVYAGFDIIQYPIYTKILKTAIQTGLYAKHLNNENGILTHYRYYNDKRGMMSNDGPYLFHQVAPQRTEFLPIPNQVDYHHLHSLE